MDSVTKLELTTSLLRAVYNFSASVPGTEHLALEDLQVHIARAKYKLSRPTIIDPGHNPFDDDDDL